MWRHNEYSTRCNRKLINILIDNTFRKDFALFSELGTKSRPLNFTHINQKKKKKRWAVCDLLHFLKACYETIKNNKHHLQRKNRLLCIAVLSISRNLKLVYSVRNRTKSVQIWSYFWSVCSCIRTEYGPEITPYLNTFHAVIVSVVVSFIKVTESLYSLRE